MRDYIKFLIFARSVPFHPPYGRKCGYARSGKISGTVKDNASKKR